MRSLIVLLVLCLGLGAFIYFQEKNMPTTDEIKREEKQLFANLKKEDIHYIKIKKDNKELVLQKKDGKWICEGKPVKEYKINSLVSALPSYRYKYGVGPYDKAMDKEYGFDKPVVEFEFKAGEKTLRLIIGADTPLGNQKYILLGNKVYVGAGYPFTSQSMDAKSWQEEKKKSKGKNADKKATSGSKTVGGKNGRPDKKSIDKKKEEMDANKQAQDPLQGGEKAKKGEKGS